MSNLQGITSIEKTEDKYSYIWTINNFNYLREGNIQFIESPCFVSKNKQHWNLGLSFRDSNILIDHYHTNVVGDKASTYSYYLTVLNEKNEKCRIMQREYTHNGNDAVPRIGQKNARGLPSAGCWRFKLHLENYTKFPEKNANLLVNNTLKISFDLSISTYQVNQVLNNLSE